MAKKIKEKHSVSEVRQSYKKSVASDALSASEVRQATIGNRIAKARLQSSTSIDAFSNRTGIPVSTLKKYESGHRVPGGEALQAIAEIGINAHWLLTGDGRMHADELHPDAHADGPVDRAVLRDVVETLQEVLMETGRELAPDAMAELILLLCDEITEQEGKRPGKDKIVRLLKLVG